MQIFNLNISAFIDKINDCAIFIISFLKNIFNNIIAIRNVDFSLVNIPNSFGIIWHFILSILCILVFITILSFMDSIFNIIKTIIKWILCSFKLLFKLLFKLIKLLFKLIKWIFSPKSESKQPVQTDNSNLDELKQLNKKISYLEYRLNLQKKTKYN